MDNKIKSGRFLSFLIFFNVRKLIVFEMYLGVGKTQIRPVHRSEWIKKGYVGFCRTVCAVWQKDTTCAGHLQDSTCRRAPDGRTRRVSTC